MENKFPLLPALFTLLVFIFMWFKIRMKSKTKHSSKNLPPGPWKLPLIGHLHLFIFNSSLPHHRMRDLAKKHGPLMHLKLGELSHMIVSSPEAAQQVLKTHDINFANRPPLLVGKIMFYDFADIIFAPYGSYWRELRKICTVELFSAKRVQSFRSIWAEQVSNLIASTSSNSATGLPINLGKMLFNLSYSITTRTTFSGRGNQQHDAVKFSSQVKILMEELAGFSVADLFPSIKFLSVMSGMKTRLERLHQDLDEILERIIQQHKANKAELNNGSDHNVTEYDLVDVLLNLQDHGDLEFPLTNDNIKGVILDMFAAGTETMSTVLEWAMSELMKNPRVMEKAQAEVRQVFGKTGDVNESNSKLDELNYMKLVIKETLRLHPPGPLLSPRENVERCEINGYEIPVNSRLLINAWAMGRDPQYWKEAEKFNPERFVDSSIDYIGASFEYLPFGAGRRICPGMSYGMAVVELCLANLLYHFDWKLPHGMKPQDLDMTEAYGITATRKLGLCLIPISKLRD